MADLRLDTEQVLGAGAGLRRVAQEFTDANAGSDALGDALGHDGLAAAVRGFAHGWDDHRAAMVEAITCLAEACTAIAEGFQGLDTELAAALEADA